MWLSEQLSQSRDGRSWGISTGKVTIAGDASAVMLEGERRDLPMVCPAGMKWVPAVGDEVAVLCSGDGERLIIGKTGGSTAGLLPGEIKLSCGDTGIVIGREGVLIEGDVSINGRLLLNGVDVAAVLAALGG